MSAQRHIQCGDIPNNWSFAVPLLSINLWQSGEVPQFLKVCEVTADFCGHKNTKSLVFPLLFSPSLHMSTFQALIALSKICIALSGVKYSLKWHSNLAGGSNIALCFHGTDVILITSPHSIVAKCSRGFSALEELFPSSMTETKLPRPASKLWAEQVRL